MAYEETAPQYIQVLRLLAPGQKVSYGQVARLAEDKFDWYRKCENPRQQMASMLRAALQQYPQLLVEENGKKCIDTTKALAFADEKYPLLPEPIPASAVAPISARPDGPERVPAASIRRRRFLFGVMGLIAGMFFLFPPNRAMTPLELADKLYRAGDVEGLLRLNRNTTEQITLEPTVYAEYEKLQEAVDLPLKFEFNGTRHPLREEIARRVADFQTEFIPLNDANLVGVFPYLEEPMWLVRHQDGLTAIRLGNKIVLPDGSAGTVIAVDQYKLTLVNDSGRHDQYRRKPLKVFGILSRSTGPKSIIYPQPGRGNWEALAAFLQLPIDPGVGNISGVFPPWRNLYTLETILKTNSVRISLGFHNAPINYHGPADELISHLFADYPAPVKVNMTDEPVWYRGEPLPDLLDYLDITMEFQDGELNLWGPTALPKRAFN
ncbi:MAG: hypothetical protein QNK37_00140 [Acidobacteriota bacterium]|nr:hypothetical protein [Acidobacteriota bacterium]